MKVLVLWESHHDLRPVLSKVAHSLFLVLLEEVVEEVEERRNCS